MNDHVPRVSVGMPVYNGEDYMEEAVHSILEQSYSSLELIIADNASEDGTERIGRALSVEDNRVRYFRHSENLGAAPNYNFTLEQARGEFFMWAAHDDLRSRDFLDRAIALFEVNPEASSIFSAAVQIDEFGNAVKPLGRPDELLSVEVGPRLRAALTCIHPALVVFGLMRRSVLESTNRHGAYPGADRVLAAELALKGPFIEIPYTMFYSRNHPARYVQIGRQSGHEAKSLWWDARREGKIDVPALTRLRNYFKAVARSGFHLRSRLSCYLAIIGAMVDHRAGILREIAGDLFRAVEAHIGILFGRRFRR